MIGELFDAELHRLSKADAFALIKNVHPEVPVGSVARYLETDGEDRIYGWLLKVTGTQTEELTLRLKPGEVFLPDKAKTMMETSFRHSLCAIIQSQETQHVDTD